MMKKTLSLMIILSASLSTSLYARNAMRDITDYRHGLEQATVLNDQANVEIYATALVEAITQAKITTAPKQKQTYDGNHQLPIQVKDATYKWGKKATKQQAEELYRALDALAVAGSYESERSELAKLLNGAFVSSKAKTTHIQLASKRYQTTLQAITTGKSSSVLYALTQTAAIQLPYAQSTYVGQVQINQKAELLNGLTYKNFYPHHGWITEFYVPTPTLQKALRGEHITTHLVKETKGKKTKGQKSVGLNPSSPPPSDDESDPSASFPPPPPPPPPPLSSIPIPPPLSSSSSASPDDSADGPPPPPPFSDSSTGRSVGSPPPSSGGGGLLDGLSKIKLRKAPDKDEGKAAGGVKAGAKEGSGPGDLAAAAAAAAAKRKTKEGKDEPTFTSSAKKAVGPVIALHANDGAIDSDQWAAWVAAWKTGVDKGDLRAILIKRFQGKKLTGFQEKFFTENSEIAAQIDAYKYEQGKDAIVKK